MHRGYSSRRVARRTPDLTRGGAAAFNAHAPQRRDLHSRADTCAAWWYARADTSSLGGGTQSGDAFDDIPVSSLPAGTGRRMQFTGMTVLKVEDGLITEEIGLDDGVTALKQLGLIPAD